MVWSRFTAARELNFKLDAVQVEHLCCYRAAVETATLREAMSFARPWLVDAMAQRVD